MKIDGTKTKRLNLNYFGFSLFPIFLFIICKNFCGKLCNFEHWLNLKKKKTHNKIWKIRKIFSFLSIIKKILYVSIRIFVIKSSSHKYYRDSTESNGNINQEAPPTSKNKLHEAERTFQHAHLVPFFHTHILFVIYLLDSLPEWQFLKHQNSNVSQMEMVVGFLSDFQADYKSLSRNITSEKVLFNLLLIK